MEPSPSKKDEGEAKKEEARKKEEEARKRKEEEARKKEEETRKRKEEEQRKREEEAARKKKEEEAARKKKEEEEQRKKSDERKKKAEEEEEARKKQEMEEESKKKDEEARKKEKEENNLSRREIEAAEARAKAAEEATARLKRKKAKVKQQLREVLVELDDSKRARRVLDLRLAEREERRYEQQRVTQAAASKYPIYRIFSGAQQSWIGDLRAALNVAHERLRSAGSRHPKPHLREGTAARPIPDDCALTDLDEDAFCRLINALLKDKARVGELQRNVAILRDNDSAPDNVTLSVNALSKVLRLKQKPVAIIVCGHEKSGKTTVVEAIIDLRLGFTQAGRATLCPVIYIIEKPDGNNGEDMTYALGKSVSEVQKGGIRRPLSELAAAVETHMKGIISAKGPNGFDLQPLYVRIVASCAKFVGWLIDTPGTLPTAQGRSVEEFTIFNEGVKEMIATQISETDPDSSVVLCVESRKVPYVNGGVGQFYDSFLSQVEGFQTFKDRVCIVFNHNDYGFAGTPAGDASTPWLHPEWRPSQADQHHMVTFFNEVRKNFFANGPRRDVFFTTMCGIGTAGGIYETLQKAPNETEAQFFKRVAEARQLALDTHSAGVAAAFQQLKPDLAVTFEAERTFHFRNLIGHVTSILRQRSNSLRRSTLDAIEKLLEVAARHEASLTLAALEESKFNNATLVAHISNSLLNALSTFGAESSQFLRGWAHQNLRFDRDAYATMQLDKWPLRCTYNWPASYHTETPDQTLERFAEIKKFKLDYPTKEELDGLLSQYIDAWDIRTLNLSSAYNVMIDGLFLRLGAVQLKWLEEAQIYAAMHEGMHVRGEQRPIFQAAFNKAMELLELVYTQFFALLEDIVTHWLYEAVDVAILWMCSEHSFNQGPDLLLKYEAPIATLRAVSREAIKRWVKRQIPQQLPDFASSGEEKLQAKYLEFATHVSEIKKADTKKGYDNCDTLRSHLLAPLDKKFRKSFRSDPVGVVLEFDVAGEQPLDHVLRVFALQHQRYYRFFYNEWRYVKFNMIFGDPVQSGRHDQLKTMLAMFAQQAPMEMRMTSFAVPLKSGRHTHTDSVLFVDPLSQEELDAYLGRLYRIENEMVRGAKTRKETLEELRKTLSPAPAPAPAAPPA